jgi:hypothetical protein
MKNMSAATTEERASLTFVITDVIRHLATAKMKSEILASESFVRGKAKDTINRIGLKCNAAINEVRDMLSPESRKVMDSELITPEVFLQIDGVVTAMYAMPKGIRDEIEDYVMSRYSVYSLNKVA